MPSVLYSMSRRKHAVNTLIVVCNEEKIGRIAMNTWIRKFGKFILVSSINKCAIEFEFSESSAVAFRRNRMYYYFITSCGFSREKWSTFRYLTLTVACFVQVTCSTQQVSVVANIFHNYVKEIPTSYIPLSYNDNNNNSSHEVFACEPMKCVKQSKSSMGTNYRDRLWRQNMRVRLCGVRATGPAEWID